MLRGNLHKQTSMAEAVPVEACSSRDPLYSQQRQIVRIVEVSGTPTRDRYTSPFKHGMTAPRASARSQDRRSKSSTCVSHIAAESPLPIRSPSATNRSHSLGKWLRSLPK